MKDRWTMLAAGIVGVALISGPALAQSTGSGSGTPPASGSGSSSQSAPSATQPGTPMPPSGGAATSKTPGAMQSSPGTSQSGAPSSGTGTMGSSGPSQGMKHSAKSGGAKSDQVKSVQQALQDKGHDPGPIDGVMGPKTMAALRAFQKDQKLPETGRLDDQTRGKLGVSL